MAIYSVSPGKHILIPQVDSLVGEKRGMGRALALIISTYLTL